MYPATKHLIRLAVIGLLFFLCPLSQARAQSPFFRVRPGLTLNQAAFNIATIGRAFASVPPYALGFNPYLTATAAAGFPGGYGGFGGYGGGYGGYYPPYSSFSTNDATGFQGLAGVISAKGNFLVNQQQAVSDLINNRRRLFDQYIYEGEHTPTREDKRQRSLLQELTRARNNPPLTEIWSGKSLNDLLANLRSVSVVAERAPLPPSLVDLDRDMLRHINFVPANAAGNVALLKNEGRLNWPYPLTLPEFAAPREETSDLVQSAVRQAEDNGRVDPKVLRQLREVVWLLHDQLRRNSADLFATDYVGAKSYLNSLEDAVRSLQQPNVSSYLAMRTFPAVKTTPELVRQMAARGLKFAPAVQGDESAYLALHQALVNYDLALTTPPPSRDTQVGHDSLRGGGHDR